MDPFTQAVEKIVREQENVIGPLALEQAKRVHGLSIDLEKNQISFSGNRTEVLEHLVEQYQKLFGQASVQVCKDAARPFLSKVPPQEVPALLK
jgi:hypothetical protein